MSVTFKDNSKEVLNKFISNKNKALTAIGIEAIGITNDYMTHKYGAGSKGSGIHDTGELKSNVNFKVRESDSVVDIGNSLNYAIWVHEGTGKMKARPYLKDAVTENTKIWREIAAEHLGEGF